MTWTQQVVWWFSALTGYSQEITLSIPLTVELQASVYEAGHPVAECLIKPGSKEHQMLSSWLAKNSTGWVAAPASYAPGILVSSPGFSINFVNNLVVINYSEGQYTHSAGPRDPAFLRCGQPT